MEIELPPDHEYVPQAVRLLATITLPALLILAIMLVRLILVFFKKGYSDTLTVIRGFHIAAIAYCFSGLLLSIYCFLSYSQSPGALWASQNTVIGICFAVHGVTLIAAGLLIKHAATTIKKL